MTKFIQFLHPGGEHGPDTGSTNFKGWNYRDHKRKFIRMSGEWTDKIYAAPRTGTFTFWGEWEAQSSVLPLQEKGAGRLPRWIHTISFDGDVLKSVPPAREWQNTDPYVFGDQFLYSICRQFNSKKGTLTKLASLEAGDIILFGSHVDGNFALDTVFVVEAFVPVTPDVALPNWASPLYRSVTFDRIQFPSRAVRLYRGAGWVPGKPFSFAPCLPFNGSPKGFARPVIRPQGPLRDKITPAKNQNYKVTEITDHADVVRAWSAVVEQVQSQGCSLATRVDEPLVTQKLAKSRRPPASLRAC